MEALNRDHILSHMWETYPLYGSYAHIKCQGIDANNLFAIPHTL